MNKVLQDLQRLCRTYADYLEKDGEPRHGIPQAQDALETALRKIAILMNEMLKAEFGTDCLTEENKSE